MDSRGQIVIPKDIRTELKLDDGSGFYVYSLTDEGILLKKIPAKELSDHKEILDELEEKSSKIKLDKNNLKKSVNAYKKTKDGNLDLI